jgi:tetratricopeptide (TPR) repeat protein
VGAEEPTNRNASSNEQCETLGRGTEKLAKIRDRGLARDAALFELFGNRPPPERFKTEADFMAGFAYKFPKLTPAAVGMLSFGACSLASVGLLDRDASSMLSNAAERCQGAAPQEENAVRKCMDEAIGGHLASKAAALKAAKDGPSDGCTQALANPEVKRLARRSIAEEEAGDLRAAIETGKEALALHPRNECQLNAIAGLYGKLGDFEQEVTWARKALELRPSFALAHVNLGNAYASMGQGARAAEAFKEAAALAPKNPLPVYSLGVLAEKAGQMQEALELYRRSVAIDPTFANGHFNLAAAAAKLKRFDEARAALERVLQLEPKSEDARAMLKQIDAAAAR